MSKSDAAILVTGGTGAQGGATADQLLKHNWTVRVLTRDPASSAARAWAASGATVVQGDMEDPKSLTKAMDGAYGVFSVQVPDRTGNVSERRHGFALVEAASKAGVKHFVHTSVAEAGKHTEFPRWETGYWYQKYWTDKWEIEEAVRNAGFVHWTVLKPAFMMDNVAISKAARMFPHLVQGELVTALLPTTRMQFIAAADVGAFARAAFENPELFDRQDIPLAAEALTMDEVAATLSKVFNKKVVAKSVDPKEARAAGIFPGFIRSQEWTNEVGYRADIAILSKYGVPLTHFEDWVKAHAADIRIEV